MIFKRRVLGDYYFQGIEVKPNDEKAELFYRLAAMKGDREAVRKVYDIERMKAERKAAKRNWSDIILSEMEGQETTTPSTSPLAHNIIGRRLHVVFRFYAGNKNENSALKMNRNN